jgi:membrane protease YdiL (CAAX protease family)
MIKLFLDFLSFLKGKPIIDVEANRMDWLQIFILNLGIHGIGIMAFGAGILALNGFIFLFPDVISSSFESIPITTPNVEIPFMLTFLLFGVVMPIIEEMIFRYPLKYRKYSILIATVFFSLMLIALSKMGIDRVFAMNLQEWWEHRRWLILNCTLIIAGVFMLSKIMGSSSRVQSVWDKNIMAVILISGIVFALFHAPIPLTVGNVPWIIVYMLRPFISALFYSFVRLKFGMKEVIFAHMAWNVITIILPIIF